MEERINEPSDSSTLGFLAMLLNIQKFLNERNMLNQPNLSKRYHIWLKINFEAGTESLLSHEDSQI